MSETEKLILLNQHNICSALGILLVKHDEINAAEHIRKNMDIIMDYIAEQDVLNAK